LGIKWKSAVSAAGQRVDDEVLAHISPPRSENINFSGSIDIDLDAELGPTGYRPLRVRDTPLLTSRSLRLDGVGVPTSGQTAKPGQTAPARAAVAASVMYGIVKPPPILAIASPTWSSTSASLSGESWVRAPVVGRWSSHSSRV
jgi:hypothetical protein